MIDANFNFAVDKIILIIQYKCLSISVDSKSALVLKVWLSSPIAQSAERVAVNH